MERCSQTEYHTAARWLEDVNARRDTVIEVIDAKACDPETSGTH